jgi:hypothetical protein
LELPVIPPTFESAAGSTLTGFSNDDKPVRSQNKQEGKPAMRTHFLLAFLIIVVFVDSSRAQEDLQIKGLLQARVLIVADTSIYEGYDQTTFYLRRGEVTFNSTMLEKKLRWEIRIDPIALSSRIVQDAFVEYKFAEEARIHLGQFKYPQSLDGQYPTSKLDFIRRSLVGRIYGDKRDIGVQFSGTASQLEYAVGVFNGNGRNLVDNNEEKDLAARVTFHPTDWLSVGGSWYEGTFLYDAGMVTAHNGDLRRLGGDVRASLCNLNIQSEYMVGTDDNRKSRGWYVQTVYSILESIELAGRLEQFDPDTRIADQEIRVFTLGGTYLLSDAVSVSVNYLVVDDESTPKNANQLIAQWQVSF